MGEPDYGRHYMNDQKTVEYIIKAAQLNKSDVVLDIGAGQGVLTKEITKKAHCIAIEVDPSSAQDLKKTKAEIIIGNALDHVDSLTFTKIVSNIPYAISEPLFYKLAKKRFDLAVMTIGENFLTVLQQETKIGIIFRSAYEVTLLKDVPKEAFTPPPRVHSCIIKVTPKETKTAEDLILQKILFLDDKKLKNALLKAYEGKRTKKEVRAVTTAPFYEKSIMGISTTDTTLLLGHIHSLNDNRPKQ